MAQKNWGDDERIPTVDLLRRSFDTPTLLALAELLEHIKAPTNEKEIDFHEMLMELMARAKEAATLPSPEELLGAEMVENFMLFLEVACKAR